MFADGIHEAKRSMSTAEQIATKVTASFEAQGFMTALGAKITDVREGVVAIACARNDGLTQQHGFFHAGLLTSILDSACGYAALSVMPPDADVLTVEFKVNLLRPADTDRVVATGTILKNGRRLVVTEGIATDESGTTIYAKMVATMIVLQKENEG